MTQQLINVGIVANDGTGDPFRTCMQKANDNFTELYGALDDFVTPDGTQILTNKTLVTPVITSPTGLVKADVGLNNVNNTADANKPVSSAQAAADALRVLKSGDTMTGALVLAADPVAPLQAATKQYADNLIAAADALVFKGLINCSANPNYPTADCGWTYRVSVAGKIGGASGINVEIGDLLTCSVDGSPAGNQATVGANWGIVQTNIDGAVTLTGTQTLTNKTLDAPVITGVAAVPTAAPGTNTTQPASTAYVTAAVVAAGIFTKQFISSNINIVSAAQGTVAHGLAAVPKMVTAHLVCVTNYLSAYVVGDIIPIGIDWQGSVRGVGLTMDATNLKYTMGNATNVFQVLDPTPGTPGADLLLTNANFKLVLKAFA